MPTGLKLPYIITIDEDTETVLAIRRNYLEQDPLRNKINYFVQYKFLLWSWILWFRSITHDRWIVQSFNINT